MTQAAEQPWARSRRSISAVADEVFAVVAAVRDDALDRHQQATRQHRRLCVEDVSALSAGLRSLLQRPGGVVTGLGLIVARDVLSDQHQYLEWWQRGPAGSGLQRLEVDLNPGSTGYYDYEAAEWFDVPRSSGRRHITGPYVDVHGTGEYILTFTVPVHADGVFLGVAGADVPASWLEDRLLDELPHDVEVVVVNLASRVVVSSSSRWLVGELVRPDDQVLARTAQDLPDLPWRAVLGDRAGPTGSTWS
jgi:hypothetical protein